ncbi:MAG TPA: tetratricopeptide repeat protein, partial [Longimicrobiales bacterium]|nr:tetratricopeptide repeat protein [Longimicrobiales bacterium]
QNALGPDHPEVARALSQMSQLQIYLGDLPTSVKLALRTAEIQSALPLGDTARFFGLLRLGNSYVRIGNYGAAERAFRRAMAEATRANGPDDSNAAEAMFLIGVVLRERGVDLEEAEQLTRRALAIRARKFGRDHPGTVGRYADLALLRSARGDHAEAIRLLREHVEILERVLGAEHPDISMAYASLGNGYIAARRPTEAVAAFRHGLDISNRTFGPEHSVTAGIYLRLGKALLDLGQLTEAEQAVRRSLAIRVRALGARVALVGFMKADLADVLIKEGRLTEAETELEEGLAIADENGVHPEAFDYRRLLRLSAEVYERLGRKADAAKYRARLGT